MKLNYSKERWEKIPDKIRELHSHELDFTDHPDKELHKSEFDRRLHIMSNFLNNYTWDGTHHDDVGDTRSKITSNVTRVEKEEEEPQSGLEEFIQGV